MRYKFSVVSAPAGAPADVGTHATHGVEQVMHAAYADPKVLCNFSGGTGAALANELIEAFDPVVSVVEGHGKRVFGLLA